MCFNRAKTFEKCTKLKVAASKSSDGSQLVVYSEVAGSLRALVESASWENSMSGLLKLIIAGNINASDLDTKWSTNNITPDGHYDPDGNYNSPVGGIRGASNLKYLDMEKAVFDKNHYRDMTLSVEFYNIVLSTIILPTSPEMTIIPENFLCHPNPNIFGDHEIKSICIPSNYKTIGKNAFSDCISLSHIYTTRAAGDDYLDSNYDHGDNTITLPSTLTSIATGAFATGKETVTDVYVLAKKAPKCEKDAFSSGMYVGWNGYHPSHPICRDNYVNGDGDKTWAILHFPSDVTKEQLNNYTDPTRDYTLRDETGATDGNGNPKMWPIQSEYNRSYNQAIAGYTWDAWSKDRADWTNAIYDNETNKNGSIVDSTKTFNTDYIGWHQFVLAESTNLKENGQIVDFSRFKDNDWYTICVPYNLTRSQLNAFFGDNSGENGTTVHSPKVVTLTSVTRNISTGQITLWLSKDLMADDADINVEQTGYKYSNYVDHEDDYVDHDGIQDPIVIRRGNPYLIKPWFKEDANGNVEARPEKYLVAVKDWKPLDPSLTGDDFLNAILKQDFKVQAKNEKGELLDANDIAEGETGYSANSPYIYQFIGCYVTKEMPKNVYYLGTSKTTRRSKFFYRPESATNHKAWNMYTTIIAAKPTVTRNTPSYNDKITGSTTLTITSQIDDIVSKSGQAKSYTWNFDQGTLTGIDAISSSETIDGNEVKTVYRGKVYNLNGQIVGESTEGLAKGLYIINGKKVVVK